MVNDEKKGSLKEYHNNNNNNNNQRGSGEGEKSGIGMETEGRGFSEIYRNSSEELFLKSIMESSVGMGVPTMEMLGFKNLSQNFRVDSEELFKTWLTNGENHGSSTSIAHRTRQASTRISNEIANQSTQEHVSIQQRKRNSDVLFAQSDAAADDISTDLNEQSIRNAVEKSMQANNLHLAKAWFHSTQPMTRSRSSELRRRYAAMQNARTSIGVEAMQNASLAEVNNLKQEFAYPNCYSDVPVHDNANQMEAFASPSNSSSSTFNAPQIGNVDKVSSVVNMLKGTLEHRKLANQIEKETVDDNSNGFYHPQEGIVNCIFDQVRGNSSTEFQGNFQEGQIKDSLQTVQRNTDLNLEGLMNPINPIQFGTISREQSQSESSAAAPVFSSGLEACDGPSNSSQTPSVCESSRKQVGNSRNSENGYRAKDFRERIMDTLKDDRKRGAIVRYGSVTSADSVDKGDPTKKRRVERSRKMAEAKERNSTPAIPSDMQAVFKRCENLEKEVRSLKLNLSFMNRKDSEQTKQIEELQKRNEDLADEKERLIEEIERILSETAKM